MSVASGSATRTNIIEGGNNVNSNNFGTVFKIRLIAGCDTTRARNVNGIIPTPQDFMLSGNLIQALSILRFIMTIGSCQEPLPIMVLLAYHLD